MSEHKALPGTESGGGRLWGGRFDVSANKDPIMESFNQSFAFDQIFYQVDILGSVAYAKALQKAGLVSEHERDELIRGLHLVLAEWENGAFKPIVEVDEDIHTANERRLTELIGSEIAGKLHTGRSRNDQVASDFRLFVREEIKLVLEGLRRLIDSLVQRAAKEIHVLFPGYTHLQRAQPIRWSHWLLSYASAFKRDYERLKQALDRVNVCPLGSGALAGNPFGIDRVFLGEELKFSNITSNSLDAVSDRDYVAETLFDLTLIMTHISRLSEDLIIYSSKEFEFVVLSDTYSTGSSLMPQKKNPDSLELLRGKFGRVFGSLSTLLVTLKGLPSTYNKDLQEDKEPLFDALKTLKMSLHIAGAVIHTLKINEVKMKQALNVEMLATDIAYFLVRKGVPFRQAHGISGQVVKQAEQSNCSIDQLSDSVLSSIHHLLGADLKKIFDYESSVEQYSVPGGTAKVSVENQIKEFERWLSSVTQSS